jgi:uncharacterized protein (DUF2249 family)
MTVTRLDPYEGPTNALPPTTASDAVPGLTRVLARALRALGDAGHPEAASRLAAQGWVLMRNQHRSEAERLAGLLHYLARQHPEDPFEENTMSAAGDQQLDVRTEAPARRHELIFETYADLSPGTGFVLVNDHDPKPLYYQLAAENTGEFTWDYLEEGPEVWRVRIGRIAGPASDGEVDR